MEEGVIVLGGIQTLDTWRRGRCQHLGMGRCPDFRHLAMEEGSDCIVCVKILGWKRGSLYSEVSRFRTHRDGRGGHCIVRCPDFGLLVMEDGQIFDTGGYGVWCQYFNT